MSTATYNAQNTTWYYTKTTDSMEWDLYCGPNVVARVHREGGYWVALVLDPVGEIAPRFPSCWAAIDAIDNRLGIHR